MCSIIYIARDSRIIVVSHTIRDFLHVYYFYFSTKLQRFLIILQMNLWTKITKISKSLQESVTIILSYTFNIKQATADLA